MDFWQTVGAVVVGYLIAKVLIGVVGALLGHWISRRPPSTRFYD